MRVRRCLALILLVALVATPRAQTPATPFEAAPQAPLIRLDVHPTADGRPVSDLAIADLDLAEDGTPQTIDALRHVDNPARSFVVFLDTAHMRFEGARDVRVAVARFLDRLLDDDDTVGVMTPDISPADIVFEPKAAVIPAIMQDESMWQRARIGSRDPKEDRYAQCFPANQYRDVASEMQERHREQLTLDALSQLIDFLAASRDSRTAVLTFTDGWRLFGPSGRLSSNIRSSNRRAPYNSHRNNQCNNRPSHKCSSDLSSNRFSSSSTMNGEHFQNRLNVTIPNRTSANSSTR